MEAHRHAFVTRHKQGLAAKREHTFTAKERHHEAKTGVAMPDGSFPIRNAQDLANARQAIGRAHPSKRASVEAHISTRAKALGE